MSDLGHSPAIFTLRIEGISPSELPMRRLAEYLDEFARLLGEEASTRFEGVSEGSTRIAARTLPIAVPKVRTRLTAARDGVQEDACRAVNRLDAMLSEDNASATLTDDGLAGVVIRFPGANARASRLPVIAEAGSIQGELVRIGGRDNTAHAMLRDHTAVHTCIVSKDLARALGKYLFGPLLRLHGRGRWRRTPNGSWELVDFRAAEFEILDGATLAGASTKLQAEGGFGHKDRLAGEVLDSLGELRTE